MPPLDPPLAKPIRIGGLRVLLRSADPAFWRSADRRFAQFYDGCDLGNQEDEGERYDEVVEHVLDATAAVTARDTEVTRAGDHVRMVRGTVVADWNRRARRCVVREAASGRPADPSQKHLDAGASSAIIVLLTYRLLQRGGLLAHAAGLVRDGRGYLFPGVSGAGKSTITRMSKPFCTVLSDDIVLVRLTDGGAELCGTPFHGDAGALGENVSAPLAGIYFHEQAVTNASRPLATGDAVRRLLRSTLFFDRDREAADRLLTTVTELCRRVPTHRLAFTKDPSLWECVA